MKKADFVNDDSLNYIRVAKAIDFLKNNFQKQPSLDDLANHINVSPFHFQRIFTEWAGTSPKKFLQYISVEHAKKLLADQKTTISSATEETGLSSSSRLHDLFIKIEGMSPAEYKNGGMHLSINYNYYQSPFGTILIASTAKGICHLVFTEENADSFSKLNELFPNAVFHEQSDQFQKNVLSVFNADHQNHESIKLHVKGTDFQLKVWEALLKIPLGELSNYGNIANKIGNPNASRAVGTAIGSNPVAFLIPCHRVIQSSGIIGGYMWGNTRKTAIIGWECSKNNK